MRRSAILLLLLAPALGWATPVRAQGSAAEALFDEGRKALAAGDLETACARFRASDHTEPAAGTKANLADCEERRGRVATAWELNRTVLAQLPAGDSRVPIIKQRIRKLEPRLPKLLLTLVDGAPKETTVREGETTLGDAGSYGVPLPLDPGAHHLAVKAPGRSTKTLDVTLAEGKTETVEVEPGPAKVSPSLPDKPTPAGGEVSDGVPARRVGEQADDSPSPGPWIIGGIGVAALVAGAVTGGLVVQASKTFNSDCTVSTMTCTSVSGTSAVTTVKTLGPVTTVLLAVGGAGIAAGAIWLGVRPSPKTSARIGVGPVVGGAAWRVEGSW
jgi:hypothetical protein